MEYFGIPDFGDYLFWAIGIFVLTWGYCKMKQGRK